jgi:hypothetical protein
LKAEEIDRLSIVKKSPIIWIERLVLMPLLYFTANCIKYAATRVSLRHREREWERERESDNEREREEKERV